MANMQLKFLMVCVCHLLTQLTKGGSSQCTIPPLNQAVYEGSQNTQMTCNSPTKVTWRVYPTDDPLYPSKITINSDTVAPRLTNLFAVTETNLTIKTAQSSPKVPPITTSGIYAVHLDPNDFYKVVRAKLIVIREGPSCNCTAINPTNNKVTCSIAFSDIFIAPIYAQMTWNVGGKFLKTEIMSNRDGRKGVYTCTSTLTISANDPLNYQCTVTFTKPMGVTSDEHVVMNPPDFSASCTPNC